MVADTTRFFAGSVGDRSERLLFRDAVQGTVWRFSQTGFGGMQGLGKYLNHPLRSFELHRQRKVFALWRSSGTIYSGEVKGIPGI